MTNTYVMQCLVQLFLQVIYAIVDQFVNFYNKFNLSIYIIIINFFLKSQLQFNKQYKTNILKFKKKLILIILRRS